MRAHCRRAHFEIHQQAMQLCLPPRAKLSLKTAANAVAAAVVAAAAAVMEATAADMQSDYRGLGGHLPDELYYRAVIILVGWGLS